MNEIIQELSPGLLPATSYGVPGPPGHKIGRPRVPLRYAPAALSGCVGYYFPAARKAPKSWLPQSLNSAETNRKIDVRGVVRRRPGVSPRLVVFPQGEGGKGLGTLDFHRQNGEILLRRNLQILLPPDYSQLSEKCLSPRNVPLCWPPLADS